MNHRRNQFLRLWRLLELAIYSSDRGHHGTRGRLPSVVASHQRNALLVFLDTA